MFRKRKSSAEPNFRPGVPPGRLKATQHPNASKFPEVGMTLATYKQSAFTAARAPSKLGRWQRFKAKLNWKRALITLFIIFLVIFGWLGWKFLYNGIKIFGGNLFGLFDTTRLKGEDVGRVNILLAGNSADDVGHNGADLTDSIMLVSIDTRNNRAYMLSVPRDLWVDIPGYGYSKINAAYVDGQNNNFHESGYPSGGMGLLEKTIEQTFQVPINYYGLVNYSAMKDAVNAVGGINLDIESPDPRGLYDPSIDYATNGPLVRLSNGVQHLNGEQALDLARARGDAYGSYGFPQSDFDRTANQRKMLVALKGKVTSTSTLANPVKLSKLLDAVGKNVHTDFKASEVHRLYDLVKRIPSPSIKSLSLNNAGGQDLLTNYDAPGGQSTLIPAAGVDNYGSIDSYIRKVFSNDALAKEGAQVVVLNGTNGYGVAARQAHTLEGKGLDVVAVADARSVTPTTTIIDNSGGKKPATKQILEKTYGFNVTTTNTYAGLYNADFIVVIGTDRVGQ